MKQCPERCSRCFWQWNPSLVQPRVTPTRMGWVQEKEEQSGRLRARTALSFRKGSQRDERSLRERQPSKCPCLETHDGEPGGLRSTGPRRVGHD